MEDVRDSKIRMRENIAATLDSLPEKELAEKVRLIEDRLFDFANFLEAKIALLYVGETHEVDTVRILQRALTLNKIIVLPAFDPEKHDISLLKVDDLDADLRPGPRGVPEPDPERCKSVPIDCIDVAIIPGIALDEKGGRIGTGRGYYDRFIPKLPITTRKVALALETQIVSQVPTESHDKPVDIIITDERIIYKI